MRKQQAPFAKASLSHKGCGKVQAKVKHKLRAECLALPLGGCLS